MAILSISVWGPKPTYPPVDPIIRPLDMELGELEAHVVSLNESIEHLKPGNEGRIIWANDNFRQRTKYSILFLHGFSASPREGYPLVPLFSKRYGFNAYLPLLAGHGIDSEDSFLELSPADLIHSARDALALSKILGEKTIVIGSSTGCTLAIYLAAMNSEAIDAMYLFSPNIDLADKTSNFLLFPWGMHLGRWVIGKRRTVEEWVNTEAEEYWTTTYRTEGIVALKYLLKKTMTQEVFAKVEQPFYASYYYKSEEEKDGVISIPALRRFFKNTGTAADQKKLIPNADADAHVMTCDLRVTPTVMNSILKEVYDFGEKVIGILPNEKSISLSSAMSK